MDLSQEGTTVLQQKASTLVSRGNYVEALPVLKELVNRYKGSENPTLKQNLKDILYYLGVAYLQTGKTSEAIESFKQVVDQFPKDGKARLALNLMGDCQRRMETYSDALLSFEKLRTEYTLEPAFDMSVCIKLADCYAKERKWDKALPLLEKVLKEGPDQDVRTKAASVLVTAYIEQDKFEQVLVLLPYLQKKGSRARYEAPFNLSLLNGGDRLFTRKDYETALLFYQLAFDKEELLKWYDELEKQLQEEKDAPKAGSGGMDRALELAEELGKIKDQRASLNEAEDYSEERHMRIARTYFELGRKYEAYWSFWGLWKHFPKSKMAEEGLYGAFSLAGAMGEYDKAVELGNTYIKDFEKGDRYDEVSLQLGQIYIQRREFDRTIEHYQTTLKLRPEHTYNDQIAFTTGYTLFQMEQFDRAIEAFNVIRKTYPQSSVRESCDYWIALSFLFKKDFKNAKDEFTDFVNKYNTGEYFEDANFRVGVAFYGLLKFDDAKKNFDAFIRRFPSSNLRAEAHVMLGDIAGANGDLDEALIQYKAVERHAESIPNGMTHVNYASTQIGKIHEMRKEFKEMEEFFRSYLKKWELKGNYTEAIWRIGFALKQQGQNKEMLDVYWDAIKKYGNDPMAIGIDLIINDWYPQYKTVNGKEATELLGELLKDARTKKQNPLILRMQMALAKLNDEEAKNRTFDEKDLEDASPAALIWIGEQSAAKPEFARKAYQRVLDIHSGTEWSEAATLNLAEIEATAKNFSQATTLFRLLQERFPTSPNAGVALKREGDMFKEQKKFKDAVGIYEKVLEVKDWRGPLWAESNFQIGDCYFEQNDFRKAFSYFQKVYVLYQNYTKWVAASYLKSGICLEKLNDREAAVRTYKEMLELPKLKDLPDAKEAEERLRKLQ